MKPTEQDIQAELIEGWVITDQSVSASIEDGGWFDIGKGYCRIAFYRNFTDIEFNYKEECYEAGYTDFLTNNYDLSAISQHYEPEEWQRIISMCERIVRLITGEQKTELVEASLKDKICAILYSHDIDQSDDEIEKTCITEDGFARIYAAGFLSIVIQPEDEVMHISTLTSDPKTLSHGLPVWENMDAFDFPNGSIGYVWWLDHLKPALFEIAEMLESSGEQTLEEAVRGMLPDCAELIDADSDPIEIRCGEYHLKVSRELIWWRQIAGEIATEWQMCSINSFRELINKDLYDKLPRIAAEISKHQSTRSTKPSYSDLEQRVEELEKEVSRLNGKATVLEHQLNASRELADEMKKQVDGWRDECGNKSDRITELERENASLLEKFGPIDQAEQQYAVARKEFETFTEKVGRWAQGIIELNEEIL